MNKMTIVILVLFIALFSYGAKVYADNRTDSTHVEGTSTVKADSIYDAEITAIDTTYQTIKEEVDAIKSNISSIKIIMFVCLAAILILLLLLVLAFFSLANKASNKKLANNFGELNAKIERAKKDILWESVNPKRAETYRPRETREKDMSQQKKGNERPIVASNPPIKEKEITPRQEKGRAKKEIYVEANMDDIFLNPSDQKQERSVFVIEYDPEAKDHSGDLSVIGPISALRVMKKESRGFSIKLVKSNCNWTDASDYEQTHVGRVLKDNDVWKIIYPVEIELKK
jgi:hypothetical protein